MRIISGKAGGIALSVPKGEVRPTTDRVREALFSILNPLIDHADVLDLFTGSGAFGLEALSRGAGSSRMVDFSRLSCATAKANLAKTGLEGGAVIQGDAVQFVKRELLAGRKYDIVFADPMMKRMTEDAYKMAGTGYVADAHETERKRIFIDATHFAVSGKLREEMKKREA